MNAKEIKSKNLLVLGVVLIIGFFLPVPGKYSTTNWTIPNIEFLKTMKGTALLYTLYPLIAGIIVLIVHRYTKKAAGYFLIVMGIFSFYLVMADSIIIMKIESYSNISFLKIDKRFFIIVSLVLVYLSQKIIIYQKHISGHVLGVITAFAFLFLIFMTFTHSGINRDISMLSLPFELLANSSYKKVHFYTYLIMLAALVCFIGASFLALANYKLKPSSNILASCSCGLIILGICITFCPTVMDFSVNVRSGFATVARTAKSVCWFGGLLFLTPIGILRLIEPIKLQLDI